MRNIFVYCALVLTLLWFFVEHIFLLNSEQTSFDDNEKTLKLHVEKAPVSVNVKSLAFLLGVEYEEEVKSENVEVSTQLDVTLEVILIYTSQDNHKVRLNTLINGENEEVDMQIGDHLYNYRLIDIRPSAIVLDNGKEKTTLKVFESIIISVLDSPKEKLE